MLTGLRFPACVGVSMVVLLAAPGVAINDNDSPHLQPGTRVLLDAHNAYPYQDAYADRIDRALATGVPLAIEQDLVWHCGAPDRCRSIVSHGEPFTGREPSMREHFFERIRPHMTEALARGDRRDWPLVTLNLDFKTDEPEHHAAVWALLGEYEAWLTTAPRTATITTMAPLTAGPLLVLTGEADAQEGSFHDRVPIGERLRLFGAVRVTRGPNEPPPSGVPPDDIAPRQATPEARSNYRRWWNNAWSAVEGGGPRRAGEWTARDEARLRSLVRQAHEDGLWIRFYTLNGHAPGAGQGWHDGYNFGSLEAAEVRWRAAIAAGVDFVATDQYEAFAGLTRRVEIREGAETGE